MGQHGAVTGLGAFPHVLSLLGFVFALALTQLLARLSTLVVDRKRVRFSALSLLAAANAVLLVYLNWLSLWELRSAPDWDIYSITTVFAFALSVFFTCMLSAPAATGVKADIDLEQFYWEQHRAYYAAWALCQILAIATNFVFLRAPTATDLLQESAFDLATLPAIALAFTVQKAWAQWIGGGAILLLNIAYVIAFEATLR